MFFSLAMNFIFLRLYGGMGAAYATVVNYLVLFIVMIAILKKYVHIELSNIYRYMIQSYRDLYQLIYKAFAKAL
jgi:lipopolysaccharide exporter